MKWLTTVQFTVATSSLLPILSHSATFITYHLSLTPNHHPIFPYSPFGSHSSFISSFPIHLFISSQCHILPPFSLSLFQSSPFQANYTIATSTFGPPPLPFQSHGFIVTSPQRHHHRLPRACNATILEQPVTTTSSLSTAAHAIVNHRKPPHHT